jgi:hypothetical protein
VSTLYVGDYKRAKNDHYATPQDLIAALVIGLAKLHAALPGDGPVLDPCGGAGALRDGLQRHGVDVRLTDAYPEDYPAKGYATLKRLDATQFENLLEAVRLVGAKAIVTNPPYRTAIAPRIVSNMVELVEAGEVSLAAVLVPREWVAAQGRVEMFDRPSYWGEIIPAWRPRWIAGTDAGGKTSSSWVVWRRPLPDARVVHVAKGEAEALVAKWRSLTGGQRTF